MMRACGLTFLILAALVQAGPLHAQTDPCLRRVISVSVSDRAGQTVSGLSAGDFQAEIKGKPIKIVSATRNDQPVRVMIVLDRSSSMLKDESKWNAYLTAAAALLSHMPAQSEAGLTAFVDRVLGSVPFTTDAVGLQAAIKGLSSVPQDVHRRGGSTALYDALAAAASSFDHPQPGDSLYALTDGEDDASRISGEAARKALVTKGVRLFSFSIPAGDEPSSRRATKSLQDMARKTGGDAVTVSRKLVGTSGLLTDNSGNPTEEGMSLETQFRQIFNFYRLELELPLLTQRSEAWSLRLVGLKQHDLEFTYAADLPACILASN
jgi:VWFA-related protein